MMYKTIFKCRYILAVMVFCALGQVRAQKTSFQPGKLWFDNNQRLINAHGGGVLYHEGKYYWFGEHKGEQSNAAWVGVTCYSSADLYNWEDEGVALAVSKDEDSPIVEGSTIERPKVIYNEETEKFVMYFHLELKGRGYEAAHVGIATSDNPAGPYQFIKNGRVNSGKWPSNMTEGQRTSTDKPDDYEWWTKEWMNAIENGLFVRRDFKAGQMSRDMTLFVDDDHKAYHIYSSEDNLTLHIAELTEDYLDYTGKYIRIEPGGHNEAPAIFKKDGRYFMITSGCTGWDPNAARLLTADHILGQWTLHPNPCVGKDAELTFHSQGTFILPVAGKNDAFIFMADRWRPENPIDGRYVWLPILFEDGMHILQWSNQWDLSVFDQLD
ncbi:glycoside hydrolase family 43 protein [Sphingobacterium sp. FBM7-1]|uniref:glycoside hydrolase family 43 protein n=1 Tax=Sphingobacterium sp. FBM7-1 TaxID=2886688 RepID=UPI001D129E12|nr:glycoside hydrolase family 43 protein [Sphingobacterium sp. FBM7-1]MCC2598473.1 glycoside hydrolase family 43 protein [Sphingobacterium sp. FBM7-1]